MFELLFLKKLSPRRHMRMFDVWVEDPLGSIVQSQEELGFDPVVFTCSELLGEIFAWPARLFAWDPAALVDWRQGEQIVEQGPGSRVVHRLITTPEGSLSLTYRHEHYTNWVLQALLKTDADVRLLKYRPDPSMMDLSNLSRMVTKVADRAVFLHIINGAWKEACELRGGTQFLFDVHDRPQWAHCLLDTVANYATRLVRRLADTGIHALVLDESTLGVGISPRMFDEYVYPYDARIVDVAHQAGLLVVYHNCGKSRHLLERMAATGADAIEPLALPSSSGDVDLAEAKTRVGHRVCLIGGFDVKTLLHENHSAIRDEARRCLDAAKSRGGYILRPDGQIPEVRLDNLEVLAQTVCDYGQY
jgi:uroporphyrinogen-III decarboxylase